MTADSAPFTPAESDDLRRARSDPRHFAAVYELYSLPVYRYVRTMLRSDEDAADVTAETFERALKHLDSYRGSGSPMGWLLGIARNLAADAARRAARAERSASAERLRQWHEAAPRLDGLDAAVQMTERDELLRRAVAALPAATREAIALRYASGLTVREISRVIGKGEAATQKLITRALATLRENKNVER